MGKTNEKLANSCKGAILADGMMLNKFDDAKVKAWAQGV